MKDELIRSGFKKKAAEQIDEFWSKKGITGIRVGRTLLKVSKN